MICACAESPVISWARKGKVPIESVEHAKVAAVPVGGYTGALDKLRVPQHATQERQVRITSHSQGFKYPSVSHATRAPWLEERD
jgi:hypothetical protein